MDHQESNQMEQHPVQCRNGCGFYSNAGTDGLCSVCYKDMIKKRQLPPTNMPASLVPAPGNMATLSIDEAAQNASVSNASLNKLRQSLNTASPTVSVLEKRPESGSDGAGAAAGTSCTSSDVSLLDDLASSPAASASQDPEDSGQKEGKKKKSRCQECKKKVGLTGFTCRCGGLFCSIHRYSDKHECDFDYKELGAAEIRKSNPVCVAKKVQQI